MMLSSRAQAILSEPSPLVVVHFEAAQNPYHPTTNPTGLINLGTAENYLMTEESLAWVRQPLQLEAHALHYSEFRGTLSLRTVLANFLRDQTGMASVTADNIVIGNGVSCLLESLAFNLFDVGDAVLIPAPHYTGYGEDFEHRFGVKMIVAEMDEQDGFALNSERLRHACQTATENGETIKALLINSPNNPTGRHYSQDEIEAALDFADEMGLQVIADEIYAHSLFDSSEPFESIWTIAAARRDNVHLLYGLAKDFGLSGFKFAIYCSSNLDAVNAMSRSAYFYNVSTYTQALVEQLFSVPDEITRFLSCYQQRLAEAHQHLKAVNNRTLQLPMATGQGGHFVLLDFNRFLSDESFEAESTLYNKIWCEAKVNITPGQYFKCQRPGWFRLCFANCDATVTEAFERIEKLLLNR